MLSDVLLAALTSDAARRAPGLTELAVVVEEALAAANLLPAAMPARPCPVLGRMTADSMLLLRCDLTAGHTVLHVQAARGATWTDLTAAGVLRERTA